MTYALAIYHLNLLLAFLTPKIDPAMMEMEEDEGEFLGSVQLDQNLREGCTKKKPHYTWSEVV